MTLLELVTGLSTQNVNVAVIDADTDETIIEFKSQGIAGVEGDVSARTVRKWALTGASGITVKLESAEG